MENHEVINIVKVFVLNSQDISITYRVSLDKRIFLQYFRLHYFDLIVNTTQCKHMKMSDQVITFSV